MDDLIGNATQRKAQGPSPKKHVNATRDRFDQAETPISLVGAVQAVCMTIPAGDMVTAEIVAELIQSYVLGDLTLDEVRDRTPTF